MSIGHPKKYVRDYKIVEEPKKNGKGYKSRSVYCGKYWHHDMSDQAYKGLLMIYGGLCLVWLAALVCGLLFLKTTSLGNAPAETVQTAEGAQKVTLHQAGIIYVLIPYVLQFIPAVMTAGKTVLLAISPRYMERFQYDDCVVRMRMWLVVGVAAAGAVFVGQLIAIIASAEKQLYWAAGLMAMEALIALLCWFFIRVYDRYPCVQTDTNGAPAGDKTA